jgi:hypothetical protein
MYSGVPVMTPLRVKTGVVRRAGEAEVGDLDALDAVLQQDVARLDVAVDQPLGVRRRQAVGRLHPDAQDFLQLQRPVAVELLLEREAVDVLHHEVRQPLRLRDGVDGNHVLVDDGGRRLGLASEPLAGGAAGRQLRGQHLDRDDAVQRLVERLEHHRHAAPADHFEDFVVVEFAELPRLLGRVEEVKRPAVGRRVRPRRLGAGRAPEVPGHVRPRLVARRQPFEGPSAGGAAFQVLHQRGLLVPG